MEKMGKSGAEKAKKNMVSLGNKAMGVCVLW